jgi:hypothetical protein
MHRLYIIVFCCPMLIMGCKNNPDNTKTNNTAPVAVAAPASKLPDTGTGKLMTLVADYYNLKDAFVATNAIKADSAASRLTISANDMLAYLKNDSLNTQVLKPYIDTITTQAQELLAITNDKTCEKKRLPFSKISSAMYGLLKRADIKNAGIYQQHCPMAFDEKGADWLSNESEIKNPYYGKKMIECGDVTDSLK